MSPLVLETGLGRGDIGAIVRVTLMMLSSIAALVAFIQSFRAALAASTFRINRRLARPVADPTPGGDARRTEG
ncbi:MAG: hypothetical protein V3V08_19060 [Nannocystaceae bacterium]